jgi:hypothetical protein
MDCRDPSALTGSQIIQYEKEEIVRNHQIYRRFSCRAQRHYVAFFAIYDLKSIA